MKHCLLLAVISSLFYSSVLSQTLVKDIASGTDGSNLQNLTVFGNHVYFLADDGVHGFELWKSDGTEAGTAMVKDINPGTADGLVGGIYNTSTDLVVMGNHLYFGARDGTNGFELWKTDGTGAGTVMVKNTAPLAAHGIDQTDLIVIGTTIYFRGTDGTDLELYKSDGTDAGTVIVKNINPNDQSFPRSFTEYNGELYFSADDGVHGEEIWKSDGSTLGTTLLKDIDPGMAGDNKFYYSIVFNGSLYFSANNVSTGEELYKTDGTTAGTVLFKDIQPGSGDGAPNSLSVFNNKLFFSGNNGVNGSQLWSSNGTTVGTSMFKLINATGSGGPGKIYTLGSQGFFTATSSGTGLELWVTDGTEAGTMLFLDINNAVNGNSFPQGLKVAGNKLYFNANDGTNGSELWGTDGTVAGTQMYTVCVGTCNSNPTDLTVLGDKLIFSAKNDANGRELFVLNLPVGVIEVANQLQFSMYPNPATSQLVVDAPLNSSIAIYDLQGSQLMMDTQTYDTTTMLDVVNLVPGMYLVKVTNAIGETGVRKFVKE